MLKIKKVTVAIMTAEGRLWRYLAEIDKQAEDMFSWRVSDIAKGESVMKV